MKVFASNIISLIESVVTGLVVPIILGATNYGYYRIFVLYSTYTALLHFGFIDGILLKLSGRKYNTLNRYKLRSLSISFISLELCVSLIIMFFSFLISNNIYSFIFLAVGINTFFANVYTYYQFISQATMRFNGYSIRNTVQAILTIIFTLLIWILYRIKLIININYSNYILICLIISIIMFLMCIIPYSNVTFGKRSSIKFGLKGLVKYCKIGIYLTISYQISNLIMIIDNQFVSMFFRPSTYGRYSFSYSMTNTAITLLSSVATVLLPHLKRETFHQMINHYHIMISTMMLIIYFALLGYFPLCMLIKIILPSYIQSLSYLKIFLPELGITCSVTMITFNYYNALGKSKFYFYMSLIILMISGVIDSFMLIFHNPILVAFGSFIAILIWYISSEFFLIKWYHIKWVKNLIYMLLMISSFMVITSLFTNLFIGFSIYSIIYFLISFIMYKSLIQKNIYLILMKI